MKLPTKKQIIWALENEDTYDGNTILRELSSSPKWGDGVSLCRCPLCGYETTVTNVCRSCPEAPAIEETTLPKLCLKHNVRHFIIKDGKQVWTTHKSLPMYVVET